MADERRRLRRELRLQQQESVWLQKAVFALRKAEATREKLLDEREESEPDYRLTVAGRELTLEALEESLEERIEGMLKKTREMRRNLM